MDLPKDFLDYTQQLMGDALFDSLKEGLTHSLSPVSVRLNPFKMFDDSVDIPLRDADVPWCHGGVYLSQRPNFTFDPLLHAGVYYVQEASSMFLHQALTQYVDTPVTMLDLCAAPGGKSTVARAALPEGSLLFCNEPMRNRAQILKENVEKFGHPDVIVTSNFPAEYKKSKLEFDVILTDVPCSGEGMFRKDDTAIEEWSRQNVDNCSARQREIVSDIWHCLKPGGLLIYSTCTFNKEENEDNVTWIASQLGADILPVTVDSSWNITGSLVDENPVYRFLPGITRGEGLFMAVLRKHGELVVDEDKPKKKKNKDKATKVKPLKIPNAEWLKTPEEYDFRLKNDSVIYAVSKRFSSFLDEADRSLYVLLAGVTLGEMKGKNVIPDQSLALSLALNRDSFPNVELTYNQAISFLRKESVVLTSDVPVGIVLVTYRGYPLGFEKNIGNRANNLYPAEWKIKSSHTPEDNNEIINI